MTDSVEHRGSEGCKGKVCGNEALDWQLLCVRFGGCVGVWWGAQRAGSCGVSAGGEASPIKVY